MNKLKINLIFLILLGNISLVNCSVNKNTRIIQISEYATQKEIIINTYINNLIDNYNNYIKINDYSNDYMDRHDSDFRLFRDVGYSYRVIVVKMSNNNDLYGFIFIKILSNEPIIMLDEVNDYTHYLGGAIDYSNCINCSLIDIAINYQDKLIISNYFRTLSYNYMINNTLIKSKILAKTLFEEDKNNALYSEKCMMIDKYNDFINKNIKQKLYIYQIIIKNQYLSPNIISNIERIVNDIYNNDNYFYEDLTEDIESVEFSINNKVKTIRNGFYYTIGGSGLGLMAFKFIIKRKKE